MKPSLLIAPVLLLVTLALAAPAAADFTVEITADPIEEPVPMGGGDTTQVTVTVTADTMVCAGSGDIEVTLAVENVMEEEGLVGTVSPETITFSWPAGVYGVNDTLAEPTQSGTATFTVDLGDNISRATTTHDFQVTAAYDGTQPDMCESSGGFSEDSSSASVGVEIQFPAEEPENGDGMPDEDDEDDPGMEDDQTEDGPAPGIALVLFAALAVAALKRRRS